MKKLFKVIDNRYVIEDVTVLNENDYFLRDNKPEKCPYEYQTAGFVKYPKLISCIGEANRIVNLPVIEFEDIKESSILDALVGIRVNSFGGGRRKVLENLWDEAIQSKGCWTDEDIEQAWKHGYTRQAPFSVFKKSKQPNITEIELEIEHKETVSEAHFGHQENKNPFRLKITKSTPQGDIIIIQKP